MTKLNNQTKQRDSFKKSSTHSQKRRRNARYQSARVTACISTDTPKTQQVPRAKAAGEEVNVRTCRRIVAVPANERPYPRSTFLRR